MAGNAVIKIRRDTAANWTSVNPVLALGEIGFETDTRKLKVGDGVSAWTVLLYVGGTGGAGTVTSVSVVTANGLSGTVATPTTTPALTLNINPHQHTQSVAATTWTVNHNFGRKPAAVQVLSPGFKEVGAEVLHISDNQLTVQFEQSQTGFVRVL